MERLTDVQRAKLVELLVQFRKFWHCDGDANWRREAEGLLVTFNDFTDAMNEEESKK